MKIEKPSMIRIEKIVDEAEGFRTFLFRHRLNAKPGQFVMAWLPRVDEKPFSVSFQDRERFAITVMKVGPFTEKLFNLRAGDRVGIRGPYGNSFTLRGKKAVLVGGGCGAAPMGFLADELKKAGADVNFIAGAKSRKYLIYLERMKKSGIKIFAATDDGSFGVKGFATELLKSFIGKNNVDAVYACGPEVMLKPVAEMCANAGIPCEISMERHMKCGFGICGQCCVDSSGERVCKEGPVFSGEKAMKMTEFNRYKRSASGKRVGFGRES